MALYHAVKFPSEDRKSKGPHIVVEDGQTQVLWSVVNKNGDLMEEYSEAKIWIKVLGGGEFIDHLKKSRDKADISNKKGRRRKKPTKLKDYEDLERTWTCHHWKSQERFSMMILGMILVLIQ